MRLCDNYERIDDKILRCHVCAKFCVIKYDQTGSCGVRLNRDGKLYLLVYGRAAAVNIDPMEKKPLFHFLPGSAVFSFGTLGCNLRCDNCQNHELSQMFGLKKQVKDYEKINWGHDLAPAQIVSQALKSGCKSIAYTYNEPTVFLEYALDAMKLAKTRGLKNVWVSNGLMSAQTLDAVRPYLDAVNVDLKFFSDQFYKTSCGGRLEPVLENCRRLVKAGIWLEITTLIIPTLTDDEKMLKQIAGYIKSELGDFVPWHLSAFNAAISWRLKDLPDTPLASVEKACAIGRAEGLKYVYAGNVRDSGLESTYCPVCGKVVIKRNGYEVERFDRNGECLNCGEKINGRFK